MESPLATAVSFAFFSRVLFPFRVLRYNLSLWLITQEARVTISIPVKLLGEPVNQAIYYGASNFSSATEPHALITALRTGAHGSDEDEPYKEMRCQ